MNGTLPGEVAAEQGVAPGRAIRGLVSQPTEDRRTTSGVGAKQLVKPYTGRGGAVEAIRGVDLRVDAGEVFGFHGPNGAGKSIPVRMLTTLMTIASGSPRLLSRRADPQLEVRQPRLAVRRHRPSPVPESSFLRCFPLATSGWMNS